MAQFSFGSNVGAPTSTSGIPFGGTGAPAPAFGTLGSTATQPSGSITFGTPIASVAPTVQNPGFSFGATTLGTGLNFGTPPSSAPVTGLPFGTPKQGGLNFGTPAPASMQNPLGGINFGTTTASTTTSGAIGTTTALNFGTSATNSNPLGGISFGTNTPNLSVGASTAPGTSLPFGVPVPSTGFTLGGVNATTSVTTSQNPLGGINFGVGTTNPATSASGLNPLGGISLTPAATSFNPPSQAWAANAITPALNFKSSVAPTPSTGLNFSFSSTPAKTQPTSLTLGATPTSIPIGLGGVDSSQSKTGTVTTGRTDTVAAKENPVPNEVLQSIENFKQFVKDQKAQSSDVSRGSARPFVKVREDIDLISGILTDVGNDLQRNQQQADKLKNDSAKCLHNAEMAQRTNDTPPGLQFENTAPLRYFVDLVNQFEQDLQALRLQIDVTDKHFHSLHEPKFLTSQELATGMRRLHDTFVALAGRLHSVHTQVESHKEQYLNLRKYILKDPTNIFIKPVSKEEQALDVALKGLAANTSVSGPTPFSSFGTPFGLNMATQQAAAKPPPAYPVSSTSLNFASGIGGTAILGSSVPQLGTASSLFGNTTSLAQQNTDNVGFQLQNPPPGNKRGKR